MCADATSPISNAITCEIEKAGEAATALTGLALTANAKPDPQQIERIEDVANEMLDFAEGSPRARMS